ncbi:bifunctional 3'-5' exonuclease/DNA polymerase, partial [Streptomyces californicus]
ARLECLQPQVVTGPAPPVVAAAVVEAIRAAGELAGRTAFGETPVRFPFTVAVVERYADAK